MNNETSDKDNIKNEISKLLLLSDEQLKGYLAKIKHPADLKDIFQNLPLEQQLNFFQLIDSYETKSHLVSILDIEHKDELLKALSVEEIATWLDYL